MSKIFTNISIDNIIAYATSNRGGGYSFKLTREFNVRRILDELHTDSWSHAALRSAFFIKGPLYKVSTKKELVQRVYEETLKLTGSGFTATNIPVYLFDETKGRWQVTLPKWSTGSNAGRFHDRTYLCDMKLPYGHLYTVSLGWNGKCFISKFARATDLRRLLKYTTWSDDKDFRLLRDLVNRILADLPNRKGGFVRYDYELVYDYDDECWRNMAAVHKIDE